MDGTSPATTEALICESGTWEATHISLRGPKKDGSVDMARGKKN